MLEKTYEVQGMTCVICKNNVEKTLNKLEGVRHSKVNLLENEVSVLFDETIINEKVFEKALKEAGYKLVLEQEKTLDKDKINLGISCLMAITVMIIAMMKAFPYLQALLSLFVIVFNIDLFISGYRALFKLDPNMDSLVALSAGVAFIYSIFALFNNAILYFETTAMVVVIVKLGKYIEGGAKAKTTKTIRGLATLIPMNANLIKDDAITVVPSNTLRKKDIVLIKPGESVPQDGIIIAGSSSIDESMITGESLPKEKNINDEVIGGTVNINGSLTVQINKSANMTVLANIINLTKQATMEKLPIERFSDKLARYFVFFVISISILTLFIWLILAKDLNKALNYALSVLVISCPCALGLATPAAIAVACGVAAKNGILIKKPEILEIIPKLKTAIFDKTGTLTENKLDIVEIKAFDPSFIEILSSLEKQVNHPIAKTIIEKYPNGKTTFDHLEFSAGKGLIAKKENDIYLAGNKRLFKEYDINLKENDVSGSFIAVAKNKEILGIVYLDDLIRPKAKQTIKKLQDLNIDAIMCTGDTYESANVTSRKLGIRDYRYEVRPEDKNELVLEKKKEGITAMIGDGINDALALSNADISITVKAATDIASASSDIILMKNDLDDLLFIHKLAKKTMKVIKENLFWALAYNTICIPLAAGLFSSQGLSLNPMVSAVGMWLSSMFVLANALRINSVKKETYEKNN